MQPPCNHEARAVAKPRLVVQPAATSALEDLNRRVYAKLFLTPAEDPWLGLDAPGELAGLDGGGLFVP